MPAMNPGTLHWLRVSRIPCMPVRRETDGGVIVPLWLERDGKFEADLALRLSPSEAELLHEQLSWVLYGGPGATESREAGLRPERSAT
ncbi:hypothetical protein [Streptomyces sp. UNOC14_S4]|uniref:hypothetical protein n=1 Tax=Streptomyces sp. UNOC14_S4 TaxID=2872340 RepID=UPI001E50B5BC|nr:hypothetical protein [Streptomyces sp. UNOC14_S4]MCC3768795.1 hypothetical protein [Streptomyces sp. UNOC14_S4]